ncbi:acyl-CoA dehydrogenase family protein [Methylobrevis albus]|uniref:Dibenzothiophene monooxygenase n=1 Tax=Methylobrevis albus TaxID=2793297 RepID=A0A931I455_9HYPH|nr:acyl-CoA dehydrogenase family protein [Methylobrevis albus]MBH0238921.1 acyl-CoA dehydrogenase [Methylobrevis albus]
MPPADWLRKAEDIAAAVAIRANEGDAAGRDPVDEIALLREAGFLAAAEPHEIGGGGLAWSETLPLVRIVARGSGSIGQLLGYHYVMSQSPGFYGQAPFGRGGNGERLRRRSVAEGWHWAGAANPLDPGLVLTPDGDGWRASGRKTFATGARFADWLTLSSKLGDAPVVFALPRRRAGIGFLDDWDHLGQRQTASGTILFDDVRVEPDELVAELPPLEQQPVWLNMRVPMLQLAFVNFYIGVAEGALASARDYIRSTTRAWPTSGVSEARQDPYILEHYGLLHANLAAAAALADRAAVAVDAALARGQGLTLDERNLAAAEVFAAKVNTTHTVLEVTAKVFDLMGARATARRFGFDRYWRDVRTHSLHDPVAYKAREVGNHALNGTITPHWGYT